MMSAKNRLLRLLASENLTRFLNAELCGIDLAEIIEKGKVLLVNLAPSPNLSEENGRVFGSLLLSEFFEVARRRSASSGAKLKPYYLISTNSRLLSVWTSPICSIRCASTNSSPFSRISDSGQFR